MPLRVIDMPYEQIKLEEEKLLLLKQYEPIGVIGVMNPYISGVPFIYLHELTAEYAEPKIYSIFSSVAEPEQIADIVKNLVRNLSLDRLIGNITILDGSRLLINISNCLDYYEQITEHSLSNRIRYCLYFHISCLVERLIRKEPITTCGNLEYFIQTEQTAIQNIKSSFSELEIAYALIFPMLKLNIYPIFCWKAIRSLCTFQRLPSKRKERRRNFPAAFPYIKEEGMFSATSSGA